MPILPPAATPPYDNMADVLDLARVRLNDAMQSIGGEVFTDVQPFMQVGVNGAWRRLQGYLSSLDYLTLIKEIKILGIPKAYINDPGVQVSLSWSGYYDGQNYFSQPALPQDFIKPLRLWERPTGSTASFVDMDENRKGIPSVPQLPWFQMWEWFDDQLNMPGSTTVTDLRVRYAAFLPDFEDVGVTPWYNLPVPIMRAKNSLASYICYEFCHARGDLEAQAFLDQGKEQALEIISHDMPYDGKGRTQASPAAPPAPTGAPS